MENYSLSNLERRSHPGIEEAHTFDTSIETNDELKPVKIPSQIALIESYLTSANSFDRERVFTR